MDGIRRYLIGFALVWLWWCPLSLLMDALHTAIWVWWAACFAGTWAWLNVMDRYWEWKDRPK